MFQEEVATKFYRPERTTLNFHTQGNVTATFRGEYKTILIDLGKMKERRDTISKDREWEANGKISENRVKKTICYRGWK
jgi:hypothetical protein